jgi:drug/metabolite transporter (DMT)-like permease
MKNRLLDPALWLYVLATASALILIKLGTKTGAPIRYVDGKLAFNITLASISGIALYGVSFVLYIFLVSKNALGYIVPLTTGLVYVVVFFGSATFLHEHFSTLKVLGIVVILSGVALLQLAT